MERLLFPEDDASVYTDALPQFAKVARGFMRKRPDPAVELDDLLQEGIVMLHGLLQGPLAGRAPRACLAYAVASYVMLLNGIYSRAGARKRNPSGGFVRDCDETVMAAVDRYGWRNAMTRVFLAELESLLTAFDVRVLSELVLADETAADTIEAITTGRGGRLTIAGLAQAFKVSPDTVRASIHRIRRVVAAEIRRN